jgi:hypothetical protein
VVLEDVVVLVVQIVLVDVDVVDEDDVVAGGTVVSTVVEAEV